MKQKGKTWYTHKGEPTLAKYVPPLQQACERIGQKIAATAEEIEKRLSQAKYDFHKLCMEAYNEYLKTGQPVKRFSFLTFDKMVKVEFDVNEGYIRAYRATKKDPTHKDYELINTDFSSSIMKGLPKNAEEAAARLAERVYVPGLNDGRKEFDSNVAKFPLSPELAYLAFEFWTEERVIEHCYFICTDKENKSMFDGALQLFEAQYIEETVSDNNVLPAVTKLGDCYIIEKPEARYLYKLKAVNAPKEETVIKQYTLDEVKSICDLLASVTETSTNVEVDNFDNVGKTLPTGPWPFVMLSQGPTEGLSIRKSGDYFLVHENGDQFIYKLKAVIDPPKKATKKQKPTHEETPLEEPCLCGQKSTSACLDACVNLTQNKVDSMLNH